MRLIGAADDQQNSWTGTEQFQRIKLGLEIRCATKFTKPRETFDSWGVSAPQEWEPIFNLAKCHLNFANVSETFLVVVLVLDVLKQWVVEPDQL